MRFYMAKFNALGKCPESSLDYWTKLAKECYQNGLVCALCTLPNDIKIQCKMKPVVIELVKKLGKPQIKKEADMQYTKSDFDEMKRCAKRELNKREHFYPLWVQKGKMTQEKADFELQSMKKICEYFDFMQLSSDPEQQKLF